MLPLAYDLGQHFQDFGTVFQYTDFPAGEKPSTSAIFQVKGNFHKTRRMINEMQIVQHVNSSTTTIIFSWSFFIGLGRK